MARGAQYYETSTPQLDWVKKFTRSCSRLTGKLDTTTCSQQLFQVPKAQRCSSGTGPSKRLQPTPAAPIVTLPVPDLVCVPVPLSWAGTSAQRCPGTVRSSTVGRGRGASPELPRSPRPGTCCSAVLVCGEPAPLAQVSGIVPQQGVMPSNAACTWPNEAQSQARKTAQHSLRFSGTKIPLRQLRWPISPHRATWGTETSQQG